MPTEKCVKPYTGNLVRVITSTDDQKYEVYSSKNVLICFKFTFKAGKITKVTAYIENYSKTTIFKLMGLYYCQEDDKRQLVVSIKGFSKTSDNKAEPISRSFENLSLDTTIQVVMLKYLDGEAYNEKEGRCWIPSKKQPEDRNGNIITR